MSSRTSSVALQFNYPMIIGHLWRTGHFASSLQAKNEEIKDKTVVRRANPSTEDKHRHCLTLNLVRFSRWQFIGTLLSFGQLPTLAATSNSWMLRYKKPLCLSISLCCTPSPVVQLHFCEACDYLIGTGVKSLLKVNIQCPFYHLI